jgi:hypothetical protein
MMQFSLVRAVEYIIIIQIAAKMTYKHKKFKLSMNLKMFYSIIINIHLILIELVLKKIDIFNIKQEKVRLVNFDDKRYVLDGIDTLAFGNYKMKFH